MKLSKRALAIAGSMALVGGVAFGVFGASSASAVLPQHDATNDAVTCNETIGSIRFSAAFHLGGTTPNTVTISVRSADCTDTTAGVYNPTTNPTGVSLKSVALTGHLRSSNNDCLSLVDLSTSTAGSIPGTWAVNPGTPALTNTHSTLTITQTWDGTFNDGGLSSPSSDSDSWGAQYSFVSIGAAGSGNAIGSGQSNTTAPSVTGSFEGTDGGAKTTFDASMAQSSGDFASQCYSATGLRSFTFGMGGFTFR